jgi:hypothetical protein
MLWADMSGATLHTLGSTGPGREEFARVGQFTIQQLGKAYRLAGVTLPDGTKLSKDNWKAELGEWRRKKEREGDD